MLRIRLSRVGKKGKPAYRIVVAEAKSPRDGSYLEWIGTYDPMQDPPAITLKHDRALQLAPPRCAGVRPGAAHSRQERRLGDGWKPGRC